MFYLFIFQFNFYRPTPWQIAISPDGSLTSTLLSSQLIVSPCASKPIAKIELPILFQNNPRGRQLQWSLCSKYIMILDAKGFNLLIISRNCKALCSLDLLAFRASSSDKCIKISPICNTTDGTNVSNNWSDYDDGIIDIHLVLANMRIITSRINFPTSRVNVLATTKVDELLQHGTGMYIEQICWLNSTRTMVVVCGSNSTTNLKMLASATVLLLRYSGTTTSITKNVSPWVVLQEFMITRGNPVTSKPSAPSILSFLATSKTTALPIVNVIGSPDER